MKRARFQVCIRRKQWQRRDKENKYFLIIEDIYIERKQEYYQHGSTHSARKFPGSTQKN